MSALSNAYAKEISVLKLKKYRQSYRKFIIEGPNLIQEALSQDKYVIESIIGVSSFFETIEHDIPSNIPCYQVIERELKKLSAMKTPYGALAVLKMNEKEPEVLSDILFYLDGIQDPGNLGTIMRSADWFGIEQILLGEGTVDIFNPKTIRASMGSIFRVDAIESSLDHLSDLRNVYQIIAADMEGEKLSEAHINDQVIIIIGNEGRGVQSEILSITDKHISIPRYGNQEIDSLNAAISSSIIMYALQTKKAGY